MTDLVAEGEELEKRFSGLPPSALIRRIGALELQVEQKTQWLREVTQERDALKMRVAELEFELKNSNALMTAGETRNQG